MAPCVGQELDFGSTGGLNLMRNGCLVEIGVALTHENNAWTRLRQSIVAGHRKGPDLNETRYSGNVCISRQFSGKAAC